MSVLLRDLFDGLSIEEKLPLFGGTHNSKGCDLELELDYLSFCIGNQGYIRSGRECMLGCSLWRASRMNKRILGCYWKF